MKQNNKILLIGSMEYEEEYKETHKLISNYGDIFQICFERGKVNYTDIPYINDDGSVSLNNESVLFDIIAIIDPINCHSEEGFRRLLRYELYAKRLWLFSCPDKKKYGKLYPKVKTLYEHGKQVDYKQASLLGENLKEAITQYKKYHVVSAEGTDIYFERCTEKIIIETGSINDLISQIPGGEVFFAINTCNGTLSCPASNNKIIIRNGNAIINESEFIVCEFGIGINKKIKYMKHLAISEKAFGTCHFGFGNNTSFGGTIDQNYHFDITIPDFELYGISNGKEERLI